MDHLAYVVAAAMFDLFSLVGVVQRCCCWCVYYAMMIDHVSFLLFVVDEEAAK